MLQEQDLLYNRISQCLEGMVDSGRIARVVELTSNGGHILHGIKSASNLRSILKNGIEPLSPDGGVSYWTSGVRIFTATDNVESPTFGYDSTFFDYSGNLIALTNRGVLRGLNIQTEDLSGGLTKIHERLPAKAIAILNPTTGRGHNYVNLFNLLESVLNEGYSVGCLYSSR